MHINYLAKDNASSVDAHSNKPFVTFLCPCETTPLHPAKCDRKYLRCPYFGKRVALSAGHKTWLEGEYERDQHQA